MLDRSNPGVRVTQQRSLRRWFKTVAFAVTATVAVLILAETALRIVAPERPELRSPLPFQRIDGSIIEAGPAPGTVRYQIGRRPIVLAHPVGHRIFVLGGSAAFGEKLNQMVSFGGWLQRYLRLAFPRDVWEIVNLGAGGLAARHVGALVEQIVTSEHPELLIVYSGNNEFHELRALKMLSPRFSPRAELWRRRLSRLHLYRTLRDWLIPETRQSDLADVTIPTITDITTEVDEDDRRLVTQLYRESLSRMARTSRGAGVPILLSTVADNLRDVHDRWRMERVPSEMQPLVKALDAPPLVHDRAALLRWVEAHDAELQDEAAQGRIALALLRFNEWSLARTHFERSEYLARKPFRANSALREAVRDVASKEGVGFCDTERGVSRRATGGIPGQDLFLDACHPNAEGHRIIARTLLKCIVDQNLLSFPGSREEQRDRIDTVLRSVRLADSDPWRLDHWSVPVDLDLFQHSADGRVEIEHDGTPGGLTIAGHHAYGAEYYSLALSLYDQALVSGAPRGPLLVNRALALWRLGRWQASGAALEEAVRLMPNDLEILGMCRAMGFCPASSLSPG